MRGVIGIVKQRKDECVVIGYVSWINDHVDHNKKQTRAVIISVCE